MAIKLKANSDSVNNVVKLSWTNDSTDPHLYKIYRKNVGDDYGHEVFEDYQTVSVCNIDDINSPITVLNIHPNVGRDIYFKCFRGIEWNIKESAILKKWMEEPNAEHPKGYGRGQINITSITIDEFKLDPQLYLKNSKGMFIYDVIVIGFAYGHELYNKDSFNDKVIMSIEEFLDTGRGVLASHDVISSFNAMDEGMNKLRNKFNLKIGMCDEDDDSYDDGYGFISSITGSKSYIRKNDTVVKSPWYIGCDGEKINIKYTNSQSIYAYGDIWADIVPEKAIGEDLMTALQKKAAAFYLTSFNNTAFIQVGGKYDIEEVEKKLIANMIYRLKQVTDAESFNDNYTDNSEPLAPNIINQYIIDDRKAVIEYKSDDTGTIYQYYIEGKNIITNKVEESNIITSLVTSGVKEYLWCLHPIANDVEVSAEDVPVTYNPTPRRTVVTGSLGRGYWMFRVIARDHAMNESKVSTKIFYVDGEHDDVSNRSIDRSPNAIRMNNRFRGPHESYKAGALYSQLRYNINKLKDMYEWLEKESEFIKERPIYNYANIISISDAIEQSIIDHYDIRGE